MMRPLSVVSERGLRKTGRRLAELGRVGASVSGERISAVEESLRHTLARWSAEPIAGVIEEQDCMLPGGVNHFASESAAYRESTPVGFISSGYDSLRQR